MPNPDIRAALDTVQEALHTLGTDVLDVHDRAEDDPGAAERMDQIKTAMAEIEEELGVDRVAEEGGRPEHPDKGKATCPRCGPGPQVFHIEGVEQRRHLKGFDEDGTLWIESRADVLDEDCTNERLYCAHCLHEWPLPDATAYD